MVGKTWFMQQQEARMDGKVSEADSVNARIMQLLHPTWIYMGGYFNDGAGHGYVTPDFEGSVDASLAVLPEHITVSIQQSKQGFRCVLLPLYGEGRGTTRAEALAHALEALLLATAKEDAG